MSPTLQEPTEIVANPLALAVSVGAGRSAPQPQVRNILPLVSVPDFARRLEGLTGVDAWWSPYRFENGRRDGEHWRGASAVVIDVDYRDALDKKAELPQGVAERLAARQRHLPGSLFHVTPHGLRFAFVLDRMCADRDEFKRAAERCIQRVWLVLTADVVRGGDVQPGLETAVVPKDAIPKRPARAGLEIDTEASTKLSGFFFAPNALVDGFQRAAEVCVLRAEPFRVDDLARVRAWVEVQDDADARTMTDVRAPLSVEIEDAVDAYNRDHPHTYPKGGSGTCPVCEHRGCFGMLPGSEPARWACFSSNHTDGVGVKGQSCHHGDALDLGAHSAGRDRVEHLKACGYLKPAQGTRPGIDAGDAGGRDGRGDPDPRAGARAMLAKHLHRLSVADLKANPPEQKFVLDPYIPAGQVSILAGTGGSSKTTLLTYLAVCRALGRPMFGRTDMTPTVGETVILSTEDRLEDYWRKLAALRVDLGDEFDADLVSKSVHIFDLSGVPVRLVEADRGNFHPTTVAADLAAVLREHAPAAKLVIMETVSRLAGGIETNESLSILVESAQLICREAGVAVVLVAHTSQEAARQGITDAFAARGGSALGDNGRSSMVIARLNEDIRKKFAPGADLVPEEMERTLVLVHSKSNGKPAAKPLLFTRASNLHGPVLHPAALRAKETDPAALRTKLVDLVTELVGKGVDVSKRRLTREYAIGLGSRREVEELIKDALDSGELVEGDRGNGGGKLIGPGVSR